MLLRRTDASNGLTLYRSPLLDAAGVPHAFSTRLGGASSGPFASLNLGTVGGSDVQDDLSHIRENYHRLRVAIGCDDRDRCWVHQVHGPDVCTIRPAASFESGTKADAMVTDDPGRLLSVKFADCVPILLATDDGRAVGAVHAGWRGVIAGILPAAVRQLADLSASSPARLIAAIGPCITQEFFEVGPEVAAAFRAAFAHAAPLIRLALNDKAFVDLPAAVHRQLVTAGLDPTAIDGTDRCTYRDADEFFSHRRDGGLTGRMAAMIGPRD